MKAPERIPLGRRTADVLEEEIRSGRWKKQLPGYRVLCLAMGVSRRTMDTALQILTRREIILPAQKKRARMIHPDILSETTQRPQRKNILILTGLPYQKQDVESRQILDKTAVIFGRKGWTVDFESSPEFANDTPGPAMERMVANCGDHRWLLLRPGHSVIKWCMERRLRIICVGGEPQQLKPPCVAVSTGNMIRDSAQRLAKLGHRRVCALVTLPTARARKTVIRKMEKALASHGVPFHPAYNLPEIRSQDALGLWRSLSDLFALSPPSALIATEMRHLITIYSYCLENGLQIPRDLSVIVTRESEHLEWYHPMPAHYRLPIPKFVGKIRRWVENYPASESRIVLLEPEFVEGESLRKLH